jgi:hypothetical protein
MHGTGNPEKAARIHKCVMTEAACWLRLSSPFGRIEQSEHFYERRLAAAVSMQETYDLEMRSRRETANTESLYRLLFRGRPTLGATTQFMDGAGVVKRSGDGAWHRSLRSKGRIEPFGCDGARSVDERTRERLNRALVGFPEMKSWATRKIEPLA